MEKCPIIEYLSSVKSLMGNHNQKAYYSWQIKKLSPVSMVKWDSIPELKDMLRSKFKFWKPKMKQCYANSQLATLINPEIKYVEGYALSMIPIHHAWNSWRGIHFDLTVDIALAKSSPIFSNYNSVIEINRDEYAEIVKNPHLQVSSASVIVYQREVEKLDNTI